MLAGNAPDGPTVDKAVVIAKQFGPDVINLVNVLLKRSVVPELLQQDCTPEKLTAALSELLRNPAAQVEQKGAASEALAMLRSPTGSPSDAAADAVLKVVDGQMPASTARAD